VGWEGNSIKKFNRLLNIHHPHGFLLYSALAYKYSTHFTFINNYIRICFELRKKIIMQIVVKIVIQVAEREERNRSMSKGKAGMLWI
jgi:hypothetical protein